MRFCAVFFLLRGTPTSQSWPGGMGGKREEEGGGGRRRRGKEEEEEVDGWGRGEGKRRRGRRRGEEGLTVISNMDIEFLIYSLGSSVQLVTHPFDVANQKILNVLSHNIVAQDDKQMTYMSWLVQGFCSRLGELSRTKLVV